MPKAAIAGTLACFAIVNPSLKVRVSPDLNLPVAYAKKRKEASFRLIPRRILRFLPSAPRRAIGWMSAPLAWLIEEFHRRVTVPRLARKAVAFGRSQDIGLVWAVLEGQSLVQIAPDVARALGVPLVTQVFDPLIWWLRDNEIDPHHQRAALADFDRALRASRACMTASWAMADDYQRRYGTPCVPVIASHAAESAKAPDLGRFPRSTIQIGIAGQFYAGAEP